MRVPWADHVEKLREMAETLVFVTFRKMSIERALMEAAKEYGTTTGQMKYALSYATAKGLLHIDYDAATVERGK